MANQFVQTLDKVISHGSDQKLIHHYVEDDKLEGNDINLNGQTLVNFGSCSYLGIERHPAIAAGVIDAVQRYGSQFSSSRTYCALKMYDELEGMLNEIYKKPVLVSATTSLGHIATLPVIIDDNDAVILDMQVHTSVQTATELLRARGITVTIIRHNDMEKLEEKIVELKAKHDKVWYFADGVYSMYGDYAPFEDLKRLLKKYKQFHLYIDDAHGMGWCGDQGEGVVWNHMPHEEKMVLAISLNKSIAAAGGAVVFPNKEMHRLVKHCGGPHIFSGPIQPPLLGAACASVRMHLNGELKKEQDHLWELIDHMNMRLEEAGLPQFMKTESPLFFVPSGLPRVSYNIVKRLKKDGYFLNVAAFPATPMKRSGIRFMVNGNLTKELIDGMVERLAYHYPLALAEEGSSCKKVAKAFKIEEFEHKLLKPEHAGIITMTSSAGLSAVVKRSIRDMDMEEWDRYFANNGNMGTTTLTMLEDLFSAPGKPEDIWDFYYMTIRDNFGRPILSTFYTVAMIKEDMFAPGSVSEKIEESRKNDPYYLTCKAVMMGSLMTKGEHLYLDRTHPQWKKALEMLVEQMQKTVADEGAAQLMLREFTGEEDKEMATALLELGLTELKLPNNCMIESMNWNDRDGFVSTLKSRYRSDLRREILKYEDQFIVSTEKPQTDQEIREAYDLYKAVFDGAYELNVHQLPLTFFEAICKHEEYDIIRLFLKEEPSKMVAVMFSHKGDVNYTAMIVGLDYDYVRSLGTYKQILFQTTMRARELGCEKLDLAFTADSVKKKVGARPIECRAYVQLMDHFNQALIASMSRAS